MEVTSEKFVLAIFICMVMLVDIYKSLQAMSMFIFGSYMILIMKVAYQTPRPFWDNSEI